MSKNSFKTVAELLRAGDTAASAIGAPDRQTMTRAELLRLVEQTGGALRNLGIQQNHAVAIVLPNGPEMAAAFVAVASGATAAPLNPAYRADEFDFYLGDLDAKALIVQGGPDSPARAVGGAARHSGDRADGGRKRSGRQLHAVGCRSADAGAAAARSRRRRAGAAHLRHDVAAEDRAADASATSRASARNIARDAGADAAATAASTSCRCSTSTA